MTAAMLTNLAGSAAPVLGSPPQPILPRVALRWTDNQSSPAAAASETGFVVQRAEVTGGVVGTYAPIQTVNLAGAPFGLSARTGTGLTPSAGPAYDNTVTPGKTYSYRVAAVNAGGSSAFATSPNVTVPPPPATPTNFRATGITATQVTLAWNDVLGNAGYALERSADGVNWARVALASSNATSIQRNLTLDQADYFRLQSYGTGGASPYTPVVLVP